jgi:hypothetical protein
MHFDPSIRQSRDHSNKVEEVPVTADLATLLGAHHDCPALDTKPIDWRKGNEILVEPPYGIDRDPISHD